jgi:hypothetical protein
MSIKESIVDLQKKPDQLREVDLELATAKVILKRQIDVVEQLPTFQDLFFKIEDLVQGIRIDVLTKGDPNQKKDLRRLELLVNTCQGIINSYLHLHRMAGENIKFTKLAVEKEQKEAETKALEIFSTHAIELAEIVKDFLPDEDYQVFFSRMQQRFQLAGQNEPVQNELFN